tara:strand:+ start:304 stop:567 length:264 start_codon:yes stop_codon:yes gene_type:complete
MRRNLQKNNDKNPVIGVEDGKMCINGITFELDELRESKEYLQSIGAEEAFFYPENDDELDELTEIINKMGEASPEASGEESLSYYLN